MRITLNIKRFYFTNDPLGCLDRIKVKQYYDENGNIIHTEELFKFNNLYVEEPQEKPEKGGFTIGLGTNGLGLLYQHLPMSKNDDYKKVALEEYENYKKLDDYYNIVGNQLYDGTVYLDENDEFICSLGRNLGTVDDTKVILTSSTPTQLGYKKGRDTITIYQTKNNKTEKFERTLDNLFADEIICYTDKDGVSQCFIANATQIDSIIRTLKKDKITIEYLYKDDVLFTETFYIDGSVYNISKIEDSDLNYLNHSISYMYTYRDDEYRELWFTDNGEIKIDNDDDEKYPTPTPPTPPSNAPTPELEP